MKRLSGLDASFFYMETPNVPMHVIAVSILDPPKADGDSAWFEKLRLMMASRLHLIPSFRCRVRMVPFGLDHPIWEEDQDFDLDNHLRRLAVPSPGTSRELADLIGEIASWPLEPCRPLWQMWIVEGLENGRVAMLTKVHHSIMDGVSGAAVLAHLLDTVPDVSPTAPPPWAPEAPASALSLVLRALWTSSNRLAIAEIPGVVGDIAGSIWNAIQLQKSDLSASPPRPALPFETPVLRFNRAISPDRTVAFGSARLDDIKHVKNVFGTTVNDVVLAACSLSLREYLRRHDDLPDVPLIAAVPVAVRNEHEMDQIDNRVSAMFVRLPVQLADPVDQLLAVYADTLQAKAVHGAVGAKMLRELTQFMPTQLFRGAMSLYSSLHLASRHRPPVNLIISNVPGPPIRLYAAGAPVEFIYPMGPILDGAGLNLTVLSYMDRVDLGAIACRDTVPDVREIAAGFGPAVDQLVSATRKCSPGDRPSSKNPAAPRLLPRSHGAQGSRSHRQENVP